MSIVRLLHLTDLRGCDVVTVGHQPIDWDSLLERIAEGGQVDLLCATGDFAETGLPGEFSRVTGLIRRIAVAVGVTADRVFVVPGDHDIDPRLAPGLWTRQEAFWAWAEGELRSPGVGSTASGRAYHVTAAIPGSTTPVHVLGLNSAWLGGPGDPGPRLVSQQIAALRRERTGNPRIALIHHPIDSLSDEDRCVTGLAGAIDLVLCGPKKNRGLTQLTDGVWQLSCSPLGGEVPGCQLVQIELDANGRLLGFAARAWVWSFAQRRWLRNAPWLAGAVGGRLGWGGPTAVRSEFGSARVHSLADVLARVFSTPDELRRWLCLQQRGIHALLPGGNASIWAIADEAEQLLQKRKLIDDDLIDALLDFSAMHGAAIATLGNIYPPDVQPVQEPRDAEERASSPLLRPQAVESSIADIRQQLDDAHARRQVLLRTGATVNELEDEILALQRQARGGLDRGPDARTLLAGRYLLERVLGEGGFSTVWKAYDQKQGLDVAVKILKEQLAGEPERRERFFRGAREMMKLQHPAIVRVLDPKGGDSSLAFFVMEYVPGSNLRDHVLRTGRLDIKTILAVTCRIGEALTQAHSSGMVHRDVKPANILLEPNGTPRLTDFDLVQARDTTGGTRSGGMGTLLYSAPELVQDAAHADGRADVYSLGMTVLFLLFGREPPYTDLIRPEAILARVPCTSEVRRVIRRSIQWDRRKRHPSIQEFCVALRRACETPLSREVVVLSVVAVAIATLPFIFTGAAPPLDSEENVVSPPAPAKAPDISKANPLPPDPELSAWTTTTLADQSASSGDAGAARDTSTDSPSPSPKIPTTASPRSSPGLKPRTRAPEARPEHVHKPAPEDVPEPDPHPDPPMSAAEVTKLVKARFTVGFQETQTKCREIAFGPESQTSDKNNAITLDLVVANTGKVSSAEVSGLFGSGKLGECLSEHARRVEFHRFSGEEIVISIDMVW